MESVRFGLPSAVAFRLLVARAAAAAVGVGLVSPLAAIAGHGIARTAISPRVADLLPVGTERDLAASKVAREPNPVGTLRSRGQ